jgi:GNAT superfamily N-acetyltransferase
MTFYGITGGRDKAVRPDELMVHDAAGIPTELRLSFDTAPSVETRRTLGDAINALHARTVPQDANPFALLLRDDGDPLVAGLSGVLSWQWLFVAALLVCDTWQGRGIGRALLNRPKRMR